MFNDAGGELLWTASSPGARYFKRLMSQVGEAVQTTASTCSIISGEGISALQGVYFLQLSNYLNHYWLLVTRHFRQKSTNARLI